jgi:hypothetical protein
MTSSRVAGTLSADLGGQFSWIQWAIKAGHSEEWSSFASVSSLQLSVLME